MTAAQQLNDIVKDFPQQKIQRMLNFAIMIKDEPDIKISDRLQKKIDDDIEMTQDAISSECEMLSVEESYGRLRKKYGF